MKNPQRTRFKDGLPVDAKDWTEADWQDLHEAIEKVKRNVKRRHQQQTDPPTATAGSTEDTPHERG